MKSIKIYSWNILYKNEDFDRAFDFIRNLDFDILALQEVPLSFITRLKELPHFLSYAQDWEFNVAPKRLRDTINLVVLSRYPIQRETVIPLPEKARPAHFPWQTHLLHLTGWTHPFKNKKVLSVELLLPDSSTVQFFCVHFELYIPETRSREFDAILKHTKMNVPTIIAGNFNLLELPHITLLNWLSGAPFADFIFWWRERKAFKEKLIAQKLKNPLQGRRTHLIAFSQIDHILVPESMRVIQKYVLADKVGSDHHPIMVELET